jgi:hypothetical protein
MPGSPNRAEWRKRTDARIVNERDFGALKTQQNLYVAGVLGFAGQWERSGLDTAELTQFIADAHIALTEELERVHVRYSERLIVATGATNTGVLQLTYTICREKNIPTFSVAPDCALNYEIGSLDYILPHGREFGNESDLFVQFCDEFILLGGGKQSHREIVAAHRAAKPITIIQGFGGVADEFTSEELPAARFV